MSIYWNASTKAQRKALAQYVQEDLHAIGLIVKQSEGHLGKLCPDPSQDGYASGDRIVSMKPSTSVT